jgi:hypothetical protein
MRRLAFFRGISAAIAAALCLATPAGGYKISIKGRWHERMTVLAERCLPADGAFPIKCPLPASQKAFMAGSWMEGRYWKASRWSDDPTRQTSSAGLGKFLINVGINRCINYIGPFNDFPGLLCNGHYGTMQFLHSMGSVNPGETVSGATGESAELTIRKMGDWADLSYRVASTPGLAAQPYCPIVRAYDAAGSALGPKRFPFCNSWTVDTLYGFRCSNPLNSKSCKPYVGEAEVRRAAVGALLHMVQDSYSRSHAGRNEKLTYGPYDAAEVRCRPITAFYRYDLRQAKSHADADGAPGFASECSDPKAMDPITASARIIWLV